VLDLGKDDQVLGRYSDETGRNVRLWKLELQLNEEGKISFVKHWFNVALFEALVRNGQRVDSSLLWSFIIHSDFRQNSLEAYNRPQVQILATSQRQPSRVTLNLFKYQLDALAWMKRFEETVVPQGWQISRLSPWKAIGTDILFDTSKRRFYLEPTNNEQFRLKGI
jgi:hypothetical protein